MKNDSAMISAGGVSVDDAAVPDLAAVPSREQNEIIAAKDTEIRTTIESSFNAKHPSMRITERSESESQSQDFIRSAHHKSEDGLPFEGHFTLRRPTSKVVFQGEPLCIYDLRGSQIQIKISSSSEGGRNYDGGEHLNIVDDDCNLPGKIEIKDVPDGRDSCIIALRLIYVTVALFCMVTVSFCPQCLKRIVEEQQ